MRGIGRDLIRGGHYGQRSCEPHQKAEHMAAPTNAANREESSCQTGAVHTWHQADRAPAIAMSVLERKADLAIGWPDFRKDPDRTIRELGTRFKIAYARIDRI